MTTPDRCYDRSLTIQPDAQGATHITSDDGEVDLLVRSEAQADGSTWYRETGSVGGETVDLTRDPRCLYGTFGDKQVQLQETYGSDQPGMVVDGQVIALDSNLPCESQVLHFQFAPDGQSFNGHAQTTDHAWTACIDGQISGDKILDDPQLYLIALDPSAYQSRY